jgi:phenylacetate-CoA ligase
MIRCSTVNLKRYLPIFADEIRKNKIDFYHGYPSAFHILANEIQVSGIDFPEPTAILFGSEMVYDWQLHKIQETFPNSTLYAHYGCAERTVLGGWCEHRQEYHMLPQYSLVEVDKKSNEIIGTNLSNAINAFIRYRTTDTALEVNTDPCPGCDRPYTPRLIDLGGRIFDYLYSPQNGWIPPTLLTIPFRTLKAIFETQVIQSQKDELKVCYSVRPQVEPDLVKLDLDHIQAGLHRLFGNQMELRFEEVNHFPLEASGKFKWVMCELDEHGRWTEEI